MQSRPAMLSIVGVPFDAAVFVLVAQRDITHR